MKKAVILLSILAASLDGYSQAGSWYIGGVAGYASNSDKNAAGTNTTTTSSWAFAPEAGTFLKDDIQLGLALGISGGSQSDTGGDIYSSSGLSPTIYGRKFFKITDTFSTFAGLYFNFSSGSQTNYFGGGSVETKDSGFGVRLGVGVAYALSPRFTAVGQYGLMGYQSSSSKVNGVDAGSSSDFDFGVNTTGYSNLQQGNRSGAVFNIGIYYTFKQG